MNLSHFTVTFILFLLWGCSSVEERPKKTEDSGVVEMAPRKMTLNLKVKKYELENGLTLIVSENRKLPILSYYTFFDVGGRHERKGTTGATHFLEHMMFKGAKKYGPGQIDSIIEGGGGSNNAYTNFDSTVYYESVPKNLLEKIIDLEADRMNNLLLLPKSFESERKVVFEERKMRYENSPRGQIFLAMMQSVFEGTPYGGSVIGSEEDLKNLDRDQVMDFFKKFYTPDNAIIVVVGDVDSESVYQSVVEKYGHLKRGSESILEYKRKVDDLALYRHRGRYGRWIKMKGEAPTPLFHMAFKGVEISSRKSYVLDILSSILGDGDSSYFNQKFVSNNRPLLSNVGVLNYGLKFNGVFSIYGELLQKTNLKRFKRNLTLELRGVCDKSINERSVLKTKNLYLVSQYKAMETNAGVARFLGELERIFGDYSRYKTELEVYNSITIDELKSTCKELFQTKPIFLSVWKKHPKTKGKK